jgi:hypothetical protein
MTDRRIGYCTNVHAGASWEQTRANLAQHPMGLGLWLSANSANRLLADRGVGEFHGWLADRGLVPFTLNGFPHGDFHQPVVKHRVYEPTWWEPERLRYTLQLVDILDELLPRGEYGSISTLPIAWGSPMPSEEQLRAAGKQLKQAAEYLRRLELDSGRLITICLEPEPGCVFDTSAGAIEYFTKYVLDGDSATADRTRRYIRICHDVCHAAVMFEDQAAMIHNLAAAGVGIGKVQVSSAVCVDFASFTPEQRVAAFQQLANFNEPRYLHQTVTQEVPGGPTHYYEDLPFALAAVKQPQALTSRWRVHFHVPIFLAKFGHLQTSQQDIFATLRSAAEHSDVHHFEVETYAWSVLPPELQQPTLAAGIAQEMKWFALAQTQG